MKVANQSEAERKFWETPELLETLFLWLDLEATFNLAHVMDKESLQSGITSNVWNKRIRYNWRPVDQHAVKNLATILKFMEQPKDLLLDLLDVICEGARRRRGQEVDWLQIVCPRHPAQPHNVTLAGFLLLEEVESALGTTELRIQRVKFDDFLESTSSAISSRMTRQQNPVTSMIRARVIIETGEGAQAFHTLMSGQVENEGYTNVLIVKGFIGEEGWEVVARAMQLQPHLVDFICTSKPFLAEGKKEDIKKIWDTVGLRRFALCRTPPESDDWDFTVVKPDDDWESLEKIMDMSQAEYVNLYEYDYL